MDSHSSKYVVVVFITIIIGFGLIFFVNFLFPNGSERTGNANFVTKKDFKISLFYINRHFDIDEMISFLSLLKPLQKISQIALLFKISKDDSFEKFEKTYFDKEDSIMKKFGIKKHFVLFCSTDIGANAIIRQINPIYFITDRKKAAIESNCFLKESKIVFIENSKNLETENKISQAISTLKFGSFSEFLATI
ncbi:hypothetical protein MHBO_001731 [Bonamia ostreae]|uniref:Uncharacterized protein n=1 Tax=Bonamia ostreae TaxID=126728 RepID=A0ABV2AJZ2_9EUKA